QPNGWMSRSAHLVFTLVFGFALPLFLVGLIYIMRFLPASLMNIPHRAYWLAEERRRKTLAYLSRQSLWLACLSVGFIGGVHYVVVSANRAAWPHLSTPLVLAVMG